MPRPQTISTEGILNTAKRLFLEHGHSVPTARIARAAGISEGTIFKRFGTKAELFQRAMDLPEFHALEQLSSRAGQGALRDNVERLAVELLAYFRLLLPVVMRLKASPMCDPIALLRSDPDTGPHLVLRGVTTYFREEIKLGRLRPSDPEVMARMLIGSVHNYAFFESLGVHSPVPLDDDAYVHGLLELLWTGISLPPCTT